MADSGQRTEQPTARRIDRARRDGRFPVSREFVAALQFLAFVALIVSFRQAWFGRLRLATRILLDYAFRGDLDATAVLTLGPRLALPVLTPLAIGGGCLLAVTVGTQLLTTQMGLSLKRLTPDFARLSPLSKLRELPRQNLPQLLQAVVVLPVFAWVVYVLVRDNLLSFLSLPLMPVEGGLRRVGGSLGSLLWKAAAVFLVFGAVDLFRQRHRYSADLRMSKQEIRDEMKEVDGNPQTRGRIRRLQRDLARRRMMQEVPKATAVIVNPTHYAVAIRYQMETSTAPRVVAKGKNYLALRIRQKAIENQVPVVENPPLAQSLYKSVDVGQEIPAHLYRAVAEILAYIYRLMNGRLPG
jgi:flagellar biosynthesis protein FlhB